MTEILGGLLDWSDFPPRWQCGQWTEWHGWVHIVSDLSIAAAYAAIPVVLVLVARRRGDVPFQPVFWLFACFIFACGAGHLVEASLFWWPWYRLSALAKVVTAVASWATVFALVPIVQKVMLLPRLAKANAFLRSEVVERERSERELRSRTAELERKHEDLQRFSRLVADREGRVIELKREVNGLLGELGRTHRYGEHDDA